MNQPSTNPDQKRNLHDVLEEDPSSKRGNEGELLSTVAAKPVQTPTGQASQSNRKPAIQGPMTEDRTEDHALLRSEVGRPTIATRAWRHGARLLAKRENL